MLFDLLCCLPGKPSIKTKQVKENKTPKQPKLMQVERLYVHFEKLNKIRYTQQSSRQIDITRYFPKNMFLASSDGF